MADSSAALMRPALSAPRARGGRPSTSPSPRAGRLINQWGSDHTLSVADSAVLIALDMYERAFHMDYGAKAGSCVDAYMGALDWTNADKVFKASR